MDNNLFSLFDDIPDKEESNGNSKKSKATKKKNSSASTNSNLSLFDMGDDNSVDSNLESKEEAQKNDTPNNNLFDQQTEISLDDTETKKEELLSEKEHIHHSDTEEETNNEILNKEEDEVEQSHSYLFETEITEPITEADIQDLAENTTEETSNIQTEEDKDDAESMPNFIQSLTDIDNRQLKEEDIVEQSPNNSESLFDNVNTTAIQAIVENGPEATQNNLEDIKETDQEPIVAKESIENEEVAQHVDLSENAIDTKTATVTAAESSNDTIIEQTNKETPATETTTVQVMEQHYLGEIVSTDYSLFLTLEEQNKKLQEKFTPKESVEEITEDIEITATNEAKTNTDEDTYEEEHSVEDIATESLPEWTLTKKYYSIGEVAKLFNVNTSHIRFWSKEFQLKLRTTRKGDRMYTTEDIDKLRWIHELVKVKKHTIKGAREILQSQKKKVVEKIDLKDNLKDLKSLLLGIQNKL